MTIYTILVAEQSSALRALVSGSMKEAQARTVNWEDVDEETFARWAQFVYTGDYPLVSCNIVTEPTTSTEEATPLPELQPEALPDDSLGDQWAFHSFSRTKKPTRKSDLFSERSKFHDLTYPVLSLSKFSNMCKIRPNESSVEAYLPVFLGHARFYVFAERWGIKSLQTLALHKLHATLCGYKPYKALYGDIVELIKYTYQNSPTQKRIEGLRALVTKYVTQEQIQIAKSEPCLSLVKDEGSFARDLLSMVMEPRP